ncbi:MAG TPA: tripartite tricarboxylate transporter substrate binding protein [Burkholderiales bacterium]|nr:tripartite tricarboxylate transporter substrate binding protein [Burkholderiales bacterium]
MSELVFSKWSWLARAALLMLAAGSVVVHAQDTYPQKPVKWVVPFLAGGGADTIARTVAERASVALGQQIIIDNRPGAGGNVGAVLVAKAAPDGYTLFYGTNGTHAVNASLYSNPGFDPIKDFTPVTKLTRVAMMLVVRADSPIKSLQDLVHDAKANPGKRTFGSGGNGTAPHIAGEMFKAATGVDMVHVPYKGNAAAIVDLLGGRIDMMFDVMANAYPQVQAGKLRGIAVLSKNPEEIAPHIPTLSSLGIKDFDVAAWDGVFAPAGTPRVIIDKLNAAFVTALNDPKVRQALIARGVTPTPSTPDELLQLVKSEMPRWADAVKRAGVRAD